ncbi:MAG: hypothetical protein RL095_2644 [Verrucomicrobiota bacterium]
MPRTIIYIDGFNLYYAVFKDRPQLKWFNFQSYFEALFPGQKVQVKYFSALVADSARKRQLALINAMKGQGIEIILGDFQPKDVTCRLCGKTDPRVPKEKKTDVNISVEMISDAGGGVVDQVVLVSGDSDQIPAIAWVRKHHPAIKIRVLFPKGPLFMEYQKMGVTCDFVNKKRMEEHLLPESFIAGDGARHQRPTEWR